MTQPSDQDFMIVALLENVYYRFPDDVFEALRNALLAGQQTVDLTMRSDPAVEYMRYYSRYFIDFNDMKQYNAHTNKSRKIKFTSANTENPLMKGKLVKIRQIAEVPNKEKYLSPKAIEEKQRTEACSAIHLKMTNTWLAYSEDIFKSLQQAYVDGHEKVEFVVLCDPGTDHMQYYTKYRVDFMQMKQINVHTGKTRDIRMISKKELSSYSQIEVSQGVLAKDVKAIETMVVVGESASKSPRAGEVKSPRNELKAPQLYRSSPPPVKEETSPKASGSKSPRAGETRRGDGKSPRADEPKSPRAGETRSPRAGEPKSPRAGEPKSPRAGEPKSPRAGEPKSPRAGEPKSPRAGETRSPRAGETRKGADKSPRAGEARSPRAGEGKSPQAGDKKSPRAGETTRNLQTKEMPSNAKSRREE